jgi:hypothetical protein
MPTNLVFMVIGCPGSGKSWVCEQLKDRFHYVPHDAFLGVGYLRAIDKQLRIATKPLLIEAPFSISQIKDPLERAGFTVTPVFIQEAHAVIRARYRAREGKDIPPGHLTRQHTYQQRANLLGAFQGTSSEVLTHLKGRYTQFAKAV